ncbi:cation:proton antiporter [Fluviibacterium sp. DFM31]|uniref:Cation:proton antiporter n=1 Tax=Meridianimarinicoccus marinus TaxID=3231483 RepID=A0ABV3L4B8_9RHOB
MTPENFFYWCTEAGFTLVMVSLVLGFIRLFKGPSFSDRVVALDMMTVSIVAFCALFAIRSEASAFLDVALVLALIGFLATVALARFAERSMLRQSSQPVPPPAEQIEAEAVKPQHTEKDPAPRNLS